MPNWDEKRTLWEWLRWWYSVEEEDKRRFEKAAWPDRKETPPPTLNERLDWTYEELLKLRVSMGHLEKQLPGKAGQIETWGRQLNDMVRGVARMQGAEKASEGGFARGDVAPGLVGEVEKGPLRMPERFPGTEEK